MGESKRRGKQSKQSKPSKQRKRPGGRRSAGAWTPYVIAAVALAGIVFALRGTEGHAAHHPDPHPQASAERVVGPERYAGHGRIAEVYRMAAAIPQVLDGLYCYCECSKHAGHRSLLECFESDHGANCDVCLSEAALAYRMTQEGRSLDDIRAAIDGLYGG